MPMNRGAVIVVGKVVVYSYPYQSYERNSFGHRQCTLAICTYAVYLPN